MNFISELKRRNVIRMAGLYLVGAWLLTQVAATLLPVFEAPGWMMKTIVGILAVGFIPAMIFAWVFEMTPDGLKRDAEVAPDESIAPQTARRMERMIIALFALALIFFAFDKFVLAPKRDIALVASTSKAVKAEVNSEQLVLGVAVLPFENLSADPDNAFFTSGVYEDVLTYLSRIEQLRVISRTSMEEIAKQGKTVTQIGKQLGVSHVLEGSVRRSGNQVRIAVQLIKTSNDEHVWAENYDRNLDDIFSIQTEIAKSIAQQLKTELSPSQTQLIESKPTSNLDAYALFVKARDLERVLDWEKQIPLLEQAIQLDPNFVEAEVKLVASYGRMDWDGADPKDAYRAKAVALKNKIVKEHPNTYAAIAAQGYFEYTVNRNYQAALDYFQQALLKRPNDIQILMYIASSYKHLGKFEQGIEVSKKMLLLDPESPVNARELALQLTYANRIDEALAQAKSSVKKFPNDNFVQNQMADIYFNYLGNVQEYLRIKEQLLPIKKLIETDFLYRQLTTNKENIDERIAIYDKTKKPSDTVSNVIVDSDIAVLLNTVGLENRSQQRAKQVLAEYQKSPIALLKAFGNDAKSLNAFLSYVACLANDKAAFTLYNKAYQSAPQLVLIAEYSAINHALALAECGQIEQAWELLNQQADDAKTGFTHWALVLSPEYQHYFSELPEYKALQKKLQQQKQAKKAEPAI